METSTSENRGKGRSRAERLAEGLGRQLDLGVLSCTLLSQVAKYLPLPQQQARGVLSQEGETEALIIDGHGGRQGTTQAPNEDPGD